MSGSRRRQHPKENTSSEDEDSTNLTKRHKASESTEEIEKRLESLICRVGEKSSSSLESNLEGLAVVLETDLPNFKQQILRILVLCSYQLPEKCTIYTTLIGLLNARNYNCGGEFVEMMLRELKRLIYLNRHDEAQYVVRFLADLVNCHVVTITSLFSLYESLFSVTKEDNVPQSRLDWFTYAILSTLPWVGVELQEKKPDLLKNLLTVIQDYITNKRQKNHHSFLRVWSSDDPHPQEEYLDCLWAQIVKLSNDNWVEDIIQRPYRAFEGLLADALQHNLPTFVPPPHRDGFSQYPVPRVIFRMFDYTDCPEGPVIPGSHSIERWIMEEYLLETMRTHRMDKKECSARMLSIPAKEKVPISHLVTEVMFGELFRLPASDFPEVFFTSVFIELCKLQPSNMPQVLALASEMLFERLDTMNSSCIDRFVNWFSHHLSNFQFRWSWDEWSYCLREDPAQPKPKFIQEVLEKCLRMSYHQRVCDNVPESFSPLLPAEPVCCFRYEKPNEMVGEVEDAAIVASQQLVASIKQKAGVDELRVILETMPELNSEEVGESCSYRFSRLDVLLQTLLYLAQKSFSHSCTALAKFHKLLKWAASDETGKIDVLRIIHEVWCNHPQMMMILVDKLIRTQIVDCGAVAKWLFSPDMAKDFTRLYAWEIMHSTIRKMNMHLRKTEAEFREAQEKSKFDDKVMDDEDEEESMMKSANTLALSESDLKIFEEKWEAAKTQQKNLFLIIFQRFIMILTDHLVRSQNMDKDFNTPWYKCTTERLQQMFLMHRETVQTYMSTLKNLLFTGDLDPRILSTFQQFSSLVE